MKMIIMKICMAHSSFTIHGGVGRYIVELAKRFVKDHEVHMVTSQYDYKLKGLHVHRYPLIYKPIFLQLLLGLVNNTRIVKQLNKKYYFDIIHTHVNCLFQDIISAQGCHRAWIEQLKREKGSVYNSLMRFHPATNVVLATENHVYTKRKYKRIIAPSMGIKEDIIRYYKVKDEDIVVVPNGVAIEEFELKNKKAISQKIRERHGISENDVILLFVGWDLKRKGLEHVIRSISTIKHENIKLLVVTGDKTDSYLRLARELDVDKNIILVGSLPADRLRDYYQASDIFILPTHFEAFSLATLEAAAAGLPLLLTNVHGTEILNNGYNGFFISHRPQDIGDKINTLVRNRKLRIRMGRNARKVAKEHSWNKIAKKTMDVYEEVLRS